MFTGKKKESKIRRISIVLAVALLTVSLSGCFFHPVARMRLIERRIEQTWRRVTKAGERLKDDLLSPFGFDQEERDTGQDKPDNPNKPDRSSNTTLPRETRPDKGGQGEQGSFSRLFFVNSLGETIAEVRDPDEIETFMDALTVSLKSVFEDENATGGDTLPRLPEDFDWRGGNWQDLTGLMRYLVEAPDGDASYIYKVYTWGAESAEELQLTLELFPADKKVRITVPCFFMPLTFVIPEETMQILVDGPVAEKTF